MYQQRGQLDAPSTTGINVICTSPIRYPMSGPTRLRSHRRRRQCRGRSRIRIIHNTMIVDSSSINCAGRQQRQGGVPSN